MFLDVDQPLLDKLKVVQHIYKDDPSSLQLCAMTETVRQYNRLNGTTYDETETLKAFNQWQKQC